MIDISRPTRKANVCDLLVKAGLENAGRSRYSGSKWSWIDAGNVAVFALWHTEIRKNYSEGVVRYNFKVWSVGKKGKGRTNPLEMDGNAKASFEQALQVRIIVLAGKRKGPNLDEDRSSSAEFRYLDDAIWSVTAYDDTTGDVEFSRIPPSSQFVDQFSIETGEAHSAQYRDAKGLVRIRDASARWRALERAAGRCEFCGEAGFMMVNDRTYLETHHIIALADGGRDVDENMIGLCANHHREAHFGLRGEELRLAFLEIRKPS